MRTSPAILAWEAVLRFFARLAAVYVFRIRCRGQQALQKTGGALILSNHQSNLDPILIGLVCDRGLNYVARQTLFNFAPLAWLMRSVGGFPIDREGSGLAGLKETLRRIEQGGIVVLFPEGTRTRDGEVHALKPGFCAIARRAGVSLVPLAIDGAFDSWPRGQRLPRPATICVQFGTPIEPAEVAVLSDEQLTREIETRIRACHAAARRARLTAIDPSQPVSRGE
jgi:1-acyl-sn-glycerol-3-phosphate acyltransferase